MTATSRPQNLVACGLSLFSGVLMAVQSRMNGQLSRELGQPLQASLWSFGSGLAVLLLVMLTRSHRVGLTQVRDAFVDGTLRWWTLLAGVFGALLVVVQSSVVPFIGVALFSVAMIAGQTAGSLVVDGLGLGPGEQQRLSALRALCALLALAGVGVAASSAGMGAAIGLPTLLGVVAGIGTTFQAAWNGRITQASGRPLIATTINFTTGLLTIIAVTVVLVVSGRMRLVALHGPWWVWWGGLTGLTFVAIASVVIRHIGVLVYTLLTLISQLITALVLDLFTPALAGTVSTQRLVGLAMTATAAGLAGRAAARSHRVPPRLDAPGGRG